MQRRHSREGVTSRLRLRGHDYSEPSAYLVTICAEQRTCRFGEIRDEQTILNGAGQVILQRWNELPDRFPNVELDAVVLMPNHLHAVIFINGDPLAHEFDPRAGLSRVIQAFKSLSTVDYSRGVKLLGWPRYTKRLWQEGFHDHIVRSDRELDRVREYIEANPSDWPRDEMFMVPEFRPYRRQNPPE